MPNISKSNFLKEIHDKIGKPKKLSKSLSLFDIGDSVIRIYIRYSKIHKRNQTFYGLREEDLKQLEGKNSVICFLWDNQKEPLFLPYNEFEDVFNSINPASDRQYKVQIYFPENSTELYIANAGRFNVESFLGWEILLNTIDINKIIDVPEFNHSQIQTLIGSIGKAKGYDVWIPINDRNKLDWHYTNKFNCKDMIPQRYEKIHNIIKEVDVIWLKRGSSDIGSLFEVEHSTPIFSGLLRFNDLHLTEPNLKPRFNIISNIKKKSLFLKQINRPTFKMSGLLEVCNFLEYKDVYRWFHRILKG